MNGKIIISFIVVAAFALPTTSVPQVNGAAADEPVFRSPFSLKRRIDDEHYYEQKVDDSRDLLNEIRTLIEEARRQTAAAVNARLTVLYWRIGDRILREVLGNQRAAYGER